MFDHLVSKLAARVSAIADHRKRVPEYRLQDCIMGAVAMFSLKDPSLLSFVNNYVARKPNLEAIYKIESIPSDSGLRKILDLAQVAYVAPNFTLI